MTRKMWRQRGRQVKEEATTPPASAPESVLVIPLKCPTRYDVREPLAKWLDQSLEVPANPLEPTCLRPDFKSCHVKDDLVRLASLRNCLSDAIAKPNSHKVALEEFALADSHEYHAALMAFINLGFPTRDEYAPSLKLTWKAAIITSGGGGEPGETHGSLTWDRACTIYNIAALESYLASVQGYDRDERKEASKHFATAASMMRYLREDGIDSSQQNFETVDLSKPNLWFWETCMLAQAQLAAYHVVDEDKHTIKSYLAIGAVPLFNQALKLSKDAVLTSQIPTTAEEWSVYCKAWSLWLQAKAAYHQACAAQDAQSWGLELAWLQETKRSLQSALDFAKSSNFTDMQQEIQTLQLKVKERYQHALADNTSLYGEKIPTSLPTIPSKQLVKSDMELPETMMKPKKPLFQ